MKDRIIKLTSERNVKNVYELYKAVHELEIQEFKDAFFAKNKESITFDDRWNAPIVTITAHEEPTRMMVAEIRKKGNSVVVVCDNYGLIKSYNLIDVEKGHLDYLKDFII